jgi:ADP-ribose pyrophosphatase YjhB (NUDIX family)
MHRRLGYRLWALFPPVAQRLAVRLLRPKVSLGACAVIQDARGRVLLTHHTYRRPAWGLPGGFVGRHEQGADALAREIREELSVAAHIGPLLWAETARRGRHLTLYYRATVQGTPRVDGAEIDGYRYAALAELPQLLSAAARSWLPALSERPAA